MKLTLKNAILVSILLLSVLVTGCADSPDAQDNAQLEKAPLSTQLIKDAIAKDDSVVILYFYFAGGSPCIKQYNILNNIQAMYGDKVTLVPLEARDFESQQAWNDYFVRGAPTTIIVTDNGYISNKFIGVKNEPTLTEAINSAVAQ
ncbi:MAG TPA: thioredoxin [Methanosarcinaceae archaeon]|nr:thioredoxin [Methanosarcinaceae archaeon]